MGSSSLRSIVLAALIAAAGCGSLRDDAELAAPRVHGEWSALVADIRAFERRIGFEPTRNFLRADSTITAFAFCGHVSPLYLPYSYEDPAIRWVEARSEDECRAAARDDDVTYGEAEAVGQSETPVTAAMLVAPLARFVYLVIHEDCHDQFGFPYGVEEPLCNAIAFAAMTAFGRERFGALSSEQRSIERFARAGAAHAQAVREVYRELSELYAGPSAMGAHDLMRQRARIFAHGERRLDWHRGSMNNLWIANAITYSRHYPAMERALKTPGGGLAHAVALLRRADADKPHAAAFAAARGLASDTSLEFVRAYEHAIVETIDRALDAR